MHRHTRAATALGEVADTPPPTLLDALSRLYPAAADVQQAVEHVPERPSMELDEELDNGEQGDDEEPDAPAMHCNPPMPASSSDSEDDSSSDSEDTPAVAMDVSAWDIDAQQEPRATEGGAAGLVPADSDIETDSSSGDSVENL